MHSVVFKQICSETTENILPLLDLVTSAESLRAFIESLKAHPRFQVLYGWSFLLVWLDRMDGMDGQRHLCLLH